MISRKKYNFLNSLADSLTDEEKRSVKEYQENLKNKPTEKSLKYFKEMKRDVLKGDYKINYIKLLKAFKSRFKDIERKEFDDSRLNQVSEVLKYFAKEESFLKSSIHCKGKNGEFISEPSFKKGLLIIGDYGCGKSSTMKTIKSLLDNTPLTFKSYTTNRIVTSFESFEDGSDRTAYINRTKTKDAYFDDVKTEKDASNYGLHNLMKDILEERSNKCPEFKTYMTCNYLESDPDKKIDSALYEFNSRYGARVFDRLFEMCNIVEFKGGSMRK